MIKRCVATNFLPKINNLDYCIYIPNQMKELEAVTNLNNLSFDFQEKFFYLSTTTKKCVSFNNSVVKLRAPSTGGNNDLIIYPF